MTTATPPSSAHESRLMRHLRSLLLRLMIALPAFALISLPGIANMPFLTEKEDTVMDFVMEAFQASPPPATAIPLAFIDIDDRTYRIWDDPLQIPRDKLLSLIQFAVAAEARVIYVDVELSRPSCNEHADRQFIEFITQYRNTNLPPLILPQGIRRGLDETESPSLRSSFLDAALNQPDSRALRSSALFDVDDADGILRRWRIFEKVGETDDGILPSTQLLIYSLLRDSDHAPRDVMASIRAGLSDPSPSGDVHVADLEFPANPSKLSQRIVYNIPRELPPWREPQEIPDAEGVMIPYLETLPASCITDSTKNPTCQRSYPSGLITKDQMNWVKGRVVVIGASALETRDTFDTPLGMIPGSLVILNAISTLDQNGILNRPPLGFGLLLEALVVVLGYGLHALLAPRSNSFLFMAGVSLLMLPVCYVLFKYGVWLTLALPLFLSTVSDVYGDLRRKLRLWIRSR